MASNHRQSPDQSENPTSTPKDQKVKHWYGLLTQLQPEPTYTHNISLIMFIDICL